MACARAWSWKELLLPIALAIASVSCEPGGPAAAAANPSGEAGELRAILEAWAAGDCDTVKRIAPGFRASTNLRLDAAIHAYGRCFHRDGDYESAVVVLERIASREPPNVFTPRATYFLGDALYRLGRLSGAADVLAGFASRFPRHRLSVSVSYKLGRVRYAQQAWAAAEAAMALVVDAATSVFRDNALYYAGMAAYHQGRDGGGLETFERAVARFDMLLSEHPDSGYADGGAYFKGRSQFLVDRFAEAAETFDDLARRFPDSPYVDDAYYHRILCLILLGQCAQARDAFGVMQRAVEGSPRIQDAAARLDDGGC